MPSIMRTPKRLFDFIDIMATNKPLENAVNSKTTGAWADSYTHHRAHETSADH